MEQNIKNIFRVIIDNNISSNSCRMCFRETDAGHYFSDFYEVVYDYSSTNQQLKDIFEFVLNVKIDNINCTEDQLCKICFDQLMNFYIFKSNFVNMETALMNCIDYMERLLNKAKIKEDKICIKIRHSKIHKYLERHTKTKVKKDLLVHDVNNDIAMSSPEVVLPSKIGKKFFKKFSTEGKPFTCTECKGHYATASLAKLHMKRIHKLIANICNECGAHYKSKSDLDEHVLNTHGNLTTLCQKCGMSVNKKFIDKHLQMCIDLKPQQQRYVCEHCNRSWKTKAQIYAHIYGNHLFKKPFKCEICKKGFATKAYLKGHRIVHTRERKWCCQLCKRRLVDAKALKLHMRLHSGERPYQCNLCEERFVDSSRRTCHMQKKHMEKTFECVLCGLRVYTNNTMRAHIRKVHEKRKKRTENETLSGDHHKRNLRAN